MTQTLTSTATVTLCVVLSIPCAKSGAESAHEAARLESVVAGNLEASVRLYRELTAPEENLLFSPFSVSSALAMAYAGAGGDTAREIRDALQWPGERDELDAGFGTLWAQLLAGPHTGDQDLLLANGMWLARSGVSDEFKALLQDSYHAEPISGGVDDINRWVASQTEGRIGNVLDELDSNSVCVLVNAVFFKGKWERQFEASNTEDAAFAVSSSEQVTVPLMYQKSPLRIVEKRDFQAVSMPYRGDRMDLVVFLPQKVDGLSGLEKQLTAVKLEEWLAQLDRTPREPGEVFLPRFSMEAKLDAVPALRRMGIQDAFDQNGKADFQGMGRRKGDLWISGVNQKTVLVVNEEGTEATAATTVGMATYSEAPVFRADHPFLFLIRDKGTQSILFMGRMVNPDAR